MKIGFSSLILITLFLSSCSQKVHNDTWNCVEDGTVMYSLSTNGEIGGAQKGCSCTEIREFELKLFGEVDEEALKSDFGC